jgi:hypothetical protein
VLLNLEELVALTSLADYYCALPAFSRSLYRAFAQVTIDEWDCEEEQLSMVLKAAIKLRYADLFRECIILLAGKWDTEPDLSLYDQKISKLITAVRHEVTYELADVNEKILRLIAEHPQLAAEINKIKLDADASLPEYYRLLRKGVYYDAVCDYGAYRVQIKQVLERLMGNDLKFGGSKDLSGRCPFQNYFLCATIDDDDLPWDGTQTDW